ncbi:C_GCAxxG_C_C family protein [Lacrimispora saccharolytica]|nr:C_GCAxxG_C_C family protein [Lacrimispora saccharolytica]
MSYEEIRELFLQGIDCSQVVAGAFAKESGVDQKLLRKISACFGGGMHCGETCGAVTGALMVIGMKYGHSEEGDTRQKQVMMEKTGEFKRLFREQYPSCICRDLLGHDISEKEELDKVMEKGLLLQLCPRIVEDTIKILGKIG